MIGKKCIKQCYSSKTYQQAPQKVAGKTRHFTPPPKLSSISQSGEVGGGGGGDAYLPALLGHPLCHGDGGDAPVSGSWVEQWRSLVTENVAKYVDNKCGYVDTWMKYVDNFIFETIQSKKIFHVGWFMLILQNNKIKPTLSPFRTSLNYL